MIFVAPQKEVHFFDRHFDRGVSWYREQFVSVDHEQVVCDASPSYMYDRSATKRLADLIPDARLISILRDPVERAYSHYWHNRSRGREQLSFSEAIDAEPKRLESPDPNVRATYSYLDRGRYVPQLERVCRHFSRASVKVIIFDDLRDEPESVYRELSEFLDVTTDYIPPELGRVMNRHLSFRSLTIRELASKLPTRLRDAIGTVNARKSAYPSMDNALKRRLYREFEADNQALSSWLGQDLSDWR